MDNLTLAQLINGIIPYIIVSLLLTIQQTNNRNNRLQNHYFMPIRQKESKMQKTLTVNGKRYTGKRIAKLFDSDQMTKGNDYIIHIDGLKFYANYRQLQDPPFAPVCNKSDANAIALMPENSQFGYTWSWDIWLTL